jgi:hypothetical protein
VASRRTNEKEKLANRDIFISYAHADVGMAERVYEDLKRIGEEPWVDFVDLLPGQRWEEIITKRIRSSRYFLALLSSHSVSTNGFVRRELMLALDVLHHRPPNEIYLIPARLEATVAPDLELNELQWADLFDSYARGLAKIVQALHEPVPGRQDTAGPRQRILSMVSPLLSNRERIQQAERLVNEWDDPHLSIARSALRDVLSGSKQDIVSSKALMTGLNFFEEISTAVLTRTADEERLKVHFQHLLRRIWTSLETSILNMRSVHRSPHLYEGLEQLLRRWATH